MIRTWPRSVPLRSVAGSGDCLLQTTGGTVPPALHSFFEYAAAPGATAGASEGDRRSVPRRGATAGAGRTPFGEESPASLRERWEVRPPSERRFQRSRCRIHARRRRRCSPKRIQRRAGCVVHLTQSTTQPRSSPHPEPSNRSGGDEKALALGRSAPSRRLYALRAKRCSARRRAGSRLAICWAKLLSATSPYCATRSSTCARARSARYCSRC